MALNEPVTPAEISWLVERVLRYVRHGDDNPEHIANDAAVLWRRHMTTQQQTDVEQEARISEQVTGVRTEVAGLAASLGDVTQKVDLLLEHTESTMAKLQTRIEELEAAAAAKGTEIDLADEIASLTSDREAIAAARASLQDVSAKLQAELPPTPPA